MSQALNSSVVQEALSLAPRTIRHLALMVQDLEERSVTRFMLCLLSGSGGLRASDGGERDTLR